MTNEELKTICESNALAIAGNTKQQAQHSADIEALLESISNLATLAEGNEAKLSRLEKLVQANSQVASASAARFDVLLADAQQDRQKADADRAAWQAGFSEQMNEMRLMREQSDERFAAMLARLDRIVRRIDILEQAG